MAIPSDRYKLLPLRGLKANLDEGLAGILEGEICYATDEDVLYIKEGGVLVATSAEAPVTSVNSKVGEVVLDAADIGAATAAQGALAGTAVQPADLATVATSGDYGDLTNQPTIPAIDPDTVVDADYVRTDENFTTADHAKLDGIETGAEVNPVNVSELVNDAGYITVAEVPPGGVTSVNTQTGDVVLSATDVGALAPGTVNPVYFADQAAFPDPTANHGAVAHSHADGAMFFAHGGAWNRMANFSEIPPVNNLDIDSLPVLP